MSTTVRIRPEDKARLDRLQAQIVLKTGRRLALDAILHRAIQIAAKHEEEMLLDDRPVRLTAAEKRKILELPWDFGDTYGHETIDDEIYGRDLP